MILGMALCSMKTESWASTRTRPERTLSFCVPSVKPWSWTVELVLPESKRKRSSSFLKKSWNPSCTQSIIKSLKFASNSSLSSRSWQKSCDTERIKDRWNELVWWYDNEQLHLVMQCLFKLQAIEYKNKCTMDYNIKENVKLKK